LLNNLATHIDDVVANKEKFEEEIKDEKEKRESEADEDATSRADLIAEYKALKQNSSQLKTEIA